MKSTLTLLSVAFFVCAAAIVYAAPTPTASNSKITGDYVEARTASVFCGACHYNAELMTLGQDAVMAWSFAGGTYNGVDLAGVRVVAEVTAETNLSLGTPHKTELTIDSSVSDRQVAAVTSLLQAKCGDQFGQIVATHRAPISFLHESTRYTVEAKGMATLAVEYLPDDSCCVMASDVWYSPLSPIEHRKVGYTELATYSGKIAQPWQRTSENSAFYGSFSF